MVDVSIIIVSYKSKHDLAVLLPSIFASETKYSYEVIVVDNGSTDGTSEWLQKTNFHISTMENQNTGFAHGNNLGIKSAAGKYILLLNPDTKLQPDTLQTMLDFMESRADVGIAGCKIIKPDGKLDLACRRRFPNPLNSFQRLFLRNNRNYNYSDISEDQEMEVDSVVGAFMMIRRIGVSEDRSVGGRNDFRLKDGNYLDEDFFMYGEDLDICWRCKEAGYKVWYYPKTFITHFKGASSRKAPYKMLVAFHDAMWIFYKKHYKQKYPAVLNGVVWLGIKFRMGLLITVNFFKSDPRVSK